MSVSDIIPMLGTESRRADESPVGWGWPTEALCRKSARLPICQLVRPHLIVSKAIIEAKVYESRQVQDRPVSLLDTHDDHAQVTCYLPVLEALQIGGIVLVVLAG